MANLCDNVVKIHSENTEVLKNLYENIHKLDKKCGWNIRLCDLLAAYGIDYEKENIPTRGSIYFYQLDEESNVLSLDYESAWCPMDEAFDAINEKLGDVLCICRRSVECGCEIYSVKDSMGDFPEECLVSASGEPFEEGYEVPFDTINEAIEFWLSKMSISRDGRSDEELMQVIEDYEYADDTYFYIHPFEFE